MCTYVRRIRSAILTLRGSTEVTKDIYFATKWPHNSTLNLIVSRSSPYSSFEFRAQGETSPGQLAPIYLVSMSVRQRWKEPFQVEHIIHQEFCKLFQKEFGLMSRRQRFAVFPGSCIFQWPVTKFRNNSFLPAQPRNGGDVRVFRTSVGFS